MRPDPNSRCYLVEQDDDPLTPGDRLYGDVQAILAGLRSNPIAQPEEMEELLEAINVALDRYARDAWTPEPPTQDPTSPTDPIGEF